jgi:Putative zinc dependent peptidase (DUF5700)
VEGFAGRKEVAVLTIDASGAEALVDLLGRIAEGHAASTSELEAVLAANAYFVDFYSQWDGCDRETIRQAMCRFNQLDRLPFGLLPTRLAQGFREAVQQRDLLSRRLTWLREVETAHLAARVLAFLPPDTPLDSTIHITVDGFNNAFVSRGEMGVSLLKGMADRETFEEAVAHELHHVGFQHWAARDATRQALLQEQSGRAVAVRHVQNLLQEGMANHYLSPRYVFRASSTEPPTDAFQARLARLAREEGQLFARAETILAAALEAGAEYGPCSEAFRSLALDLEEALLPAAHFLGARMVQTMDRVHARERIVRCVRALPGFLPLYNAAARETGGFVFGARTVARFGRLWDRAAPDPESPGPRPNESPMSV